MKPESETRNGLLTKDQASRLSELQGVVVREEGALAIQEMRRDQAKAKLSNYLFEITEH